MIGPIESAAARIPARSRRRAMDWSLALLSQGIESIVEFSPESGWGLVVLPAEYDAACEVIRQYRLENLGWPWRRRIRKDAEWIFDWGSLGWTLLVIAFYWAFEVSADLRSVGIMDGDALAHGQWWRLFTAVFLHADLAHLAANATFGFLLLGLAMGRHGTGVGLLAAYLAGVTANLATWWIDPGHRGLGASGMVLGALGLIAVQPLWHWKRNPHRWRSLAIAVAASVMLFVLLGLSPGTDTLAHAGGFLNGVLIGALLSAVPRLAQRAWANAIAGILFAALVIVPWLLALWRQ